MELSLTGFIDLFSGLPTSVLQFGRLILWVEDHDEAWIDGEIVEVNGSTLIAVNPNRGLPNLYSSMAEYKGAALGELSPRPFVVADAAYRERRTTDNDISPF